MLYAFVQVQVMCTLYLFSYAYVCIITDDLSRDILHPYVFYFRKGQ